MGCPDTVSVLALDPSHSDTARLQKPMKTAEAFARAIHSKLLATSILKPVDLPLPIAFQDGEVKGFESLTSQPIEKMVAQAGLNLSTRAVCQNVKSSTEIAACLQKVAKEESASYIIVFTHLHQTPYFAATCTQRLTESGDIPVLAINANASSIGAVRRILLATDLTKSSKPAFEGALALAKEMEAELVLYHHVISPALSQTSSAHGLFGLVSLSQIVAEWEAIATARAVKWVSYARIHGVRARHVIEMDSKSTVDMIVNAADSNACDLIIVGHHARPPHLIHAGRLMTRLLNQSLKPVLIVNGGA